MNNCVATNEFEQNTATVRVYIRTYGCQMNVLDSQIIHGLLAHDGFDCVANEEEADVILFNTCSVRDLSERKVLGKLGMLQHTRKRRPERVFGVCGCMAQRAGERLIEKNPHIDFVCGTRARNMIPALVKSALHRRVTEATETRHNTAHLARLHAACSATDTPFARCATAPPDLRVVIDDTGAVDERYAYRSRPWSAFVEIMRGCSNHCSYCVVPSARGPEVSRPAHEIITEIEELAATGCVEVTLLGQNVNSYGKDRVGETPFPALLRAVAAVSGIERVRFLTSNPHDISPELIEAMASTPEVCHHLHFPLQSGSDTILRAMNRRYTRAEYLALVERIRTAVPDCAFSSDFIVGFPGETDQDFAATHAAMEEIQYASAFIFKYSPRAGTPAAAWEDDVPREVKEARHATLLACQNAHTAAHHAAHVGSVQKVLVDGVSARNDAMLQGRTDRYFNVVFAGDPSCIGTFVPVEITDHTPLTLYGELVTCAHEEPCMR